MAVKPSIRKDGNGNLKKVTLTPVKAIRFHCVECMGFSPKDIEGCSSPNVRYFITGRGIVEISNNNPYLTQKGCLDGYS